MTNEQTDPSKSISKSDFAKLVADPATEVLKYRSLGFAAVTLAFCVFWLLLGLYGYQRQELHCNRETNNCVLQADGPITHKKSTLPLDSITEIRAFVSRGPSNRIPTCKVELKTTTRPVKLVSDRYDEDAPCEQMQRFAQECRAFLEDPAQPRLDAGYGPVDSWELLRMFLVIAFVFFLLTRESVKVAVSPTFGVVGVSSRAFGWRFYSTFPLASIACCTIDGRRFKPYMALVLADGKHWKFSPADHFHWRRRRRFKAALNEALERGRKRASARHGNLEPT